MKYFVYFCVLAALLSLALAHPVTQELQSADQAMIESEGPTDVEQAVAQFEVCRCYKRANGIVCYMYRGQ